TFSSGAATTCRTLWKAMKSLYLLRHAKSSWKDPGLDDHDRPLNKRGRQAAKLMATYLRRSEITPDGGDLLYSHACKGDARSHCQGHKPTQGHPQKEDLWGDAAGAMAATLEHS